MKIANSLTESSQINKFLSERLDDYNSNFMAVKSQDVCFYINDDNKKIIAGLTGESYGLGLYIKLFWVDETQRGSGLGQNLLQLVETRAKEIGCKFITLDTFSFQAPDFYAKYGYKEFGILDCRDGIKRYYLTKNI